MEIQLPIPNISIVCTTPSLDSILHPDTVLFGKPCLLIAKVTSRVTLNYTWELNGARLTTSDDTLRIDAMRWADTGTYRCSVTNLCGVSAPATKQFRLVLSTHDTLGPTKNDHRAPTITTALATNDTVFATPATISGTAKDSSGIYALTVNGIAVKVDSTGAWSTVVPVRLGKDTIIIIATDNATARNVTRDTIIVFCDPSAHDQQGPALAFTAPNDGDTVPTASVLVRGTAQDPSGICSLTVNGTKVVVDNAANTWSANVTLRSGKDSIVAVATDNSTAHNVSRDTLYLVYSSTYADTTKPQIRITSPAAGATVGSTSITVNGTATDVAGIAGVTVNTRTATYSNDGTWSVNVTLTTGANTIKAIATDNRGNIDSTSVSVSLLPPPGAPTALKASGITTNSITLSWTSGGGKIDSFVVVRDSTRLPKVLPPGATFADTFGLAAGTGYSYIVKACNAVDSAASTPLVVSTICLAPTGVSASSPSAKTASLAWASAKGATSYSIFRDGGAVAIGTSGTISYTDSTASSNMKYAYQIKAMNASGSSALSMPVVYAVIRPETPANLQSNGRTSKAISLSWSIVAGDQQVSYTMYRKKQNDTAYQLTRTLSVTSFTDTGLLPNTAYNYKIGALNAGGESALSAAISQITALPEDLIFVNASAAGTNDGTSWENAYSNLHTALSKAINGQQIWVAKGTYAADSGTMDKSMSFKLKAEVAVYGGFTGNDYVFANRDSSGSNCTLTGANGPSYHVVIGANNARLDGFTIEQGYAKNNNSGAKPSDNYGGGIYNYNVAMVIKNCRFQNCFAENGGVAIYNNGATLTLLACEFANNRTNYGTDNCIQNEGATAQVTNCVFRDILYGGTLTAIWTDSHMSFVNCVFSNSPGVGGQTLDSIAIINSTVYNSRYFFNRISNADLFIRNCVFDSFSISGSKISGSATLDIDGSMLPGGRDTLAAHFTSTGTFQYGSGNIAVVPAFLSPANIFGTDGKLRTSDDGLTLTNPQTGVSTNLPSETASDITGKARPAGAYDIGAYQR